MHCCFAIFRRVKEAYLSGYWAFIMRGTASLPLCLFPSTSSSISSAHAFVMKDTGYPHDGRADKDSYPHDGRADKDSYPHDRRADKDSYPHDRHKQCIMLSL